MSPCWILTSQQWVVNLNAPENQRVDKRLFLISGHSHLQVRVHLSLCFCSGLLTLPSIPCHLSNMEHLLWACLKEAVEHLKLYMYTTKLKIHLGKKELNINKHAGQNVVKCCREVLTRLIANAFQPSSELSFIHFFSKRFKLIKWARHCAWCWALEIRGNQ